MGSRFTTRRCVFCWVVFSVDIKSGRFDFFCGDEMRVRGREKKGRGLTHIFRNLIPVDTLYLYVSERIFFFLIAVKRTQVKSSGSSTVGGREVREEGRVSLSV